MSELFELIFTFEFLIFSIPILALLYIIIILCNSYFFMYQHNFINKYEDSYLSDYKKYKNINYVLQHDDKMTELMIKVSDLPEIPDEIFTYKDAQLFRCSLSKLSHIDKNISKLKNLQSLMLFTNQIQTIDYDICKLKYLTKLDLDNNQIIDIPKGIFQIVTLRILLLQSNQIEVISNEIGNLTNLETLDLSKNNIRRLPDELIKLNKLVYLSLKHNMIKVFPRVLFYLSVCEGRTKAFFDGNPILHEIIRIPKQMFINYIKEELFIKNFFNKGWTELDSQYSSYITRSNIKTLLILNLKDKKGNALFKQAQFYRLPKEIMIEIFEWLPFYEQLDDKYFEKLLKEK